MKIVVAENEPSSQRGGQEWCLLETCRGLAQRGHEIYLVYTKPGDILKDYQEFCTALIKVPAFRVNRDYPITSSINWLRSVIRPLSLRPDLIYTNYYNDILFTHVLAQLQRVPLVCHLHLFPPKRFGIQCALGLKSVTRFIAVSEATRTGYLQAGFDPQTIELVYNGIDLKRFNLQDDRLQTRQMLGIPPAAFVVLYAGRLDPPKNIEMLLQSFAQLNQTPERARLLVAGRPVNHATPEAGESYVQQLQQYCHQLGIHNSVHWLGSRLDLPEVYRAADVTVLPSLLPDTFGRVLAESMACGTPSLGLRYGGIPEVLTDEFERFQIGVGDINGLTHLLQSLENWQNADPTLGQRCHTYVEQRFSIERSVAEIEHIFQQVVALGPKRLGPSMKVVQSWNGEGFELCERT